jgi:putative FmdB family regulatory protein
MPTYEYLCPAGHEFEKFQKMSDSPRVKCPECGRMAARQISGGAGLMFKGSGFYITDYGKDGKGPRKAESVADGAGSTPAGTSEKSEKSEKTEKPAAPAKAEKPAAEMASKSARKKGGR